MVSPDCLLGDAKGSHGKGRCIPSLKVVIGVSVPSPVIRVDRAPHSPSVTFDVVSGLGRVVCAAVPKVGKVRYLPRPFFGVLPDCKVEGVTVAVLPGMDVGPRFHRSEYAVRQSIYSRLAGYDDTNDADRLSQDPAMRVVVGWKGPGRKAASTSEMSRFETELLTQKDNRKGLEQLNVEWVKRGVAKTVHRRIILDIDSSESPVHGQQEGAAYNGHFECMCYHPLFCFTGG